MRPLKTAPWLELPGRGPARLGPDRVPDGRWLGDRPARRDPITAVFVAIWTIVTLPFRLVTGVFGLLGRLTVVSAGFGMMVLGAALTAGPLAWIGVPVFVVGLLVSMRAL